MNIRPYVKRKMEQRHKLFTEYPRRAWVAHHRGTNLYTLRFPARNTIEILAVCESITTPIIILSDSESLKVRLNYIDEDYTQSKI